MTFGGRGKATRMLDCGCRFLSFPDNEDGPAESFWDYCEKHQHKFDQIERNPMKKRKYNRRTLEQQYEHEKAKLARTEAFIERLKAKIAVQANTVQTLQNRLEQARQQTPPQSTETLNP